MAAIFDGFVNPALVAGAALATVPLIIHLLNRQRHRPLSWAALLLLPLAVAPSSRCSSASAGWASRAC